MIYLPKKALGITEDLVFRAACASYKDVGMVPHAITISILTPEGIEDLHFLLMKTPDGYLYYETYGQVEVEGKARHFRVFL